jgi:hypothetical protein
MLTFDTLLKIAPQTGLTSHFHRRRRARGPGVTGGEFGERHDPCPDAPSGGQSDTLIRCEIWQREVATAAHLLPRFAHCGFATSITFADSECLFCTQVGSGKLST